MASISAESSRAAGPGEGTRRNRRTQAVAWCTAFAIAAIALVLVGFHSQDPDSSEYALISADLARQPAARWIAPDWPERPGVPFQEHPVGAFLLPALVGHLGVPPVPAAFIVGIAFSIAALFLLQRIAAVVVGERESVIVPWVALIMPVAFINRIRATQEYPVLVLTLLAVLATEKSRTSSAWIVVLMAAACAIAVVKGVFVVFVPIVCGLWLVCMREEEGSDARAWLGLAVSMVAVALVGLGYDRLYHHATGDSFLGYYLPYRLGQLTGHDNQTLMTRLAGKVDNVSWYLIRLLWFGLPGTVALLLAALPGRRPRARAAAREVRGLFFAVSAAAAYVLVMSLGSTKAERFIFPAYFAIGIAGALVAARRWDAVGRLAGRLETLKPYSLALAWLFLVLAAIPFELFVPYVKFRF